MWRTKEVWFHVSAVNIHPHLFFFSLSLPKVESGGVLSEPRMHWSRWGVVGNIHNIHTVALSFDHVSCNLSIWCSEVIICTHWVVFSFLFSFSYLVAGSLLSKMDQSIKPCDDFYTFSCGGWLKENPIPEDSSSYGIYPWLRQHVDIRLKGLFVCPQISCRHQSSSTLMKVHLTLRLDPCYTVYLLSCVL